MCAFLLFFGVIVLVVYISFSNAYAPDKLPELTSTLIGTLLGVVLAAAVGVGLFYYQGRKTEATRVQYLLESLIGELYATRDRLGATSPMRVPDPEGKGPDVLVVLTHLEPTACEELIRSALFGSRNTVEFTRLARLMREYTKEADMLSSLVWGPQLHPEVLLRQYVLAKSVKRLQQSVVEWCETILKGLEAQGVVMPSEDKYYSDPSKEAPEDYIRYDQ